MRLQIGILLLVVATLATLLQWISQSFVSHEGGKYSFKLDEGKAFCKERPESRVFMLYTPVRQGPRDYYMIDETFAFLESWRYIFKVRESRDETPAPFSMALRHDGSMPPMLELMNQTFLAMSKENRMLMPLVNDVLIVVHPLVPESQLPGFCTLLEYATTPDVQKGHLAVSERVEAARGRVSRGLAIEDYEQGKKEDERLRPSRCFIVRAMLAMTQGGKIWDQHRNIDSLAALTELSVSHLLLEYDLALRSDNDCFLTPKMATRPDLVPWIAHWTANSTNHPSSPCAMDDVAYEFMTGGGGYSEVTNRKILTEYASILGLRHQMQGNVGSTWYGRPVDLIQAAKVGVLAAGQIMEHDPTMSGGEGRWPVWYKGVMSLYAGELGVNHQVDRHRLRVSSHLLDGFVNKNFTLPMSTFLHLHCWHDPKFFNKHKRATYTEDIFRLPEFDPNKVSFYAFVCSWTGHWRRQVQEKFMKEEEARQMQRISNSSLLLQLQQGFFLCPNTHPYVFAAQTMCCQEPVARKNECYHADARYAEFKGRADCCPTEKQKRCLSGRCVQPTNITTMPTP